MSSKPTIAVTGLKKVPIHLQSAQTRVVIKGARIVNDDSSYVADVYLEDGLIKQIGLNLLIPGGTKSIDARGKLLLPGGIDARTHFEGQINGATCADDFYAGTKAALAGGTTTIINTCESSELSLTESYQKFRDAGDSKACCDFGLHVAVNKWDDQTKEAMEVICRDGGVNSFKLLLGHPDMCHMSDAEMYAFFSECRNLGAVAGITIGNGHLTKLRGAELAKEGIKGPEGFLLASPEEIEADSISRCTALANQANCPLLVDNVYSRSSMDLLSCVKRNGCVVFADTITAALAKDGTSYFSDSWDEAANHSNLPPLRPDSTLPEDLMKHLACGDLAMTSSDHRPFLIKDRWLGAENFMELPYGVQGVEERMKLVWEKGVNQGIINHCQFVAITSSNAAKLFNIYPKKGRVAVGSDADLLIWDPHKTQVLSVDNQNQNSKYSIYEGIQCKGAPILIMSNGRIVYDEDGLHVTQGAGTFVPMNTNGLFTNLKMNQRERNHKNRPKVDRKPPNIIKDEPKQAPLVEKPDEIGVPVQKRQAVKVSNPPGGHSTSLW